VPRLLSLADRKLAVRYLARVLLMRRGENDSFASGGVVRRYALGIDGYQDIAAALFGADSFEFRHIRRVVRNEFKLKMFMVAKTMTYRNPERESRAELDRLARRNFIGSARGHLALLAYRAAPPALALSALGLYRRLRGRHI
jgi:abequosyltransferase